jgi:tetratricopeptide (TPR) repeat protein
MLEWIKSKLRPPSTALLLQRAERAYAAGAPAEAHRDCLAVLRDSPDEVRALSLLASMAADGRRVEEGMQWARRAMTADASAAAPRYAAGRLWEAAGRYDEAEANYREAIHLAPDHARAHNNLGGVLHMQGRLDEALACYRRALELDPAQPEANQNYATLSRDDGARELAVAGYLRQISANPNDAGAFGNLAATYAELGRHPEALASFERAIAIDPGRAEAHYGRALLLLLCGDYAQGWKEFEWRWRIGAYNAPAHRFSQPMWDGARIDGAVLLHAEQGFGDMLQFVRYAPKVAERCSEVILECPPALEPLLQGVEGVGRVVARGAPLPPFASHLPMMSLPRIFGTTLESIPWRGPYLHADPQRVAEWRRIVDAEGAAEIKVGLVWAGNPRNWTDRGRSVSLESLAPLARAPGAVFYSVQKGEAGAQAASPPAGMKIVDLTLRLRDFADTAALLNCLDLVISVDTAVAHLAGAMGIPTWVLLPHVPDWRYLLERSDSPWYPAMRLFRQDAAGDWSGVVERMAAELINRTR